MSNRIIIGHYLYQLRPDQKVIARFTEQGTVLKLDQLLHVDGGPMDNDYLMGLVDKVSGTLYGADEMPAKARTLIAAGGKFNDLMPIFNKSGREAFLLPEELCYHGYQELSDFAALMNEVYPTTYNFRLLDQDSFKQVFPDVKIPDFDEAFKDRLNGVPVVLDIDGDFFQVDFNTESLISSSQFYNNRIPFEKIMCFYNENSDKCEIPYDVCTGNIADSFTVDEIGKRVIFAAFPPPQKMDPIGYCQKKGLMFENIIKNILPETSFRASILTTGNNLKHMTSIMEHSKNSLRARLSRRAKTSR